MVFSYSEMLEHSVLPLLRQYPGLMAGLTLCDIWSENVLVDEDVYKRQVWNMDNGGTPAIILAPALLIIFIVLAGVVPLLTDYGLMEYVLSLIHI